MVCICTAQGGGENAGYDTDGALVGSRRGKSAIGIKEEEVYLINLTE